MAETSCLSKRGGRLIAHAKDPISSGLAIDGFLAPDHFARTGGEALLLGAGGAAVAILWHLTRARADRPARIAVTDIAPDRLAHIRAIHGTEAGGVPIDYVLAETAADNDRLLAALAPGSLVVNATGLGKDAPGSPLTDAARFPRSAPSPGSSTTAATSSSSPRPAPRRQPRPRGARRLDLLRPRLDPGDRRGLRHRDPHLRPGLRRDRPHRRRRPGRADPAAANPLYSGRRPDNLATDRRRGTGGPGPRAADCRQGRG